MKRIVNAIYVLAGLVLLGALTLWLVSAFQALGSPETAGALAKTPQGYPPPEKTVPVVGPTSPPEPTPLIVYADQSPTPWLTFTPPPQPTRRPGPTEIPLPLPELAKNAAGFITFIATSQVNAWGGGNTLALYSLSVDKAGSLESTPARLTGDAELSLPWGPIHPSLDGSRLAIEGAWGDVTILNAETGQTEPLVRLGRGGGGGFLAWHPDNRQILYRGDGDYDAGLWLVGSKGFTVLVIEPTTAAIRDAAVSPDGQKVVYSFWRGFGGPAELRMINVDGSAPRILYTTNSDNADIYLLSWSPDGSKIAFIGDKGYMLMDADGQNVRVLPIYNFSSPTPFEPVWSPDGRTIAYVAFDGMEQQKGEVLDPFRGAMLRLLDVATGEDRSLLTDGSTGNIDPTWSPDGLQIAFASTRSGTSEIWAVNRDGTNLRQLTNVGQFVRFPTWRRALKSQQP